MTKNKYHQNMFWCDKCKKYVDRITETAVTSFTELRVWCKDQETYMFSNDMTSKHEKGKYYILCAKCNNVVRKKK